MIHCASCNSGTAGHIFGATLSVIFDLLCLSVALMFTRLKSCPNCIDNAITSMKLKLFYSATGSYIGAALWKCQMVFTKLFRAISEAVSVIFYLFWLLSCSLNRKSMRCSNCNVISTGAMEQKLLLSDSLAPYCGEAAVYQTFPLGLMHIRKLW